MATVGVKGLTGVRFIIVVAFILRERKNSLYT